MRKPIIAGNWKMFKTRDEALEFIYQVNNDLPSNDLVDSVVCAPFTVLRDLVKRQGENLRIGAQNMHFEEQGAFTGEIAPQMLTSLGVEYVVIGHSERRAMFNETDESVNKKLHAAFAHNLTPILCVGEHLEGSEEKVSICAKDSSGPYDYDMITTLVNLAKENKLNYAVDVYPYYGSDASAALRAGNDIKCALIGAGIQASHGMERTHLNGIINTFKLVLAYITK